MCLGRTHTDKHSPLDGCSLEVLRADVFLPRVTEEDTRRRWGSSSSIQTPLGLAEGVLPPQPGLKQLVAGAASGGGHSTCDNSFLQRSGGEGQALQRGVVDPEGSW